MRFRNIIIVGSGPIGGFEAILLSRLGLPIVVYEKREQYTRQLNVKITPKFFESAQSIYDKTHQDPFFIDLNCKLEAQKNAIPINQLEQIFKEKAQSLGIQYHQEEVKNAKTWLQKPETLVLDCTGRNSQLRAQVLNPDKTNIKEQSLQSVLYITLKAYISQGAHFNQIQHTLTTVAHQPHIKLFQIISSNQKNPKGLIDITIAAIVTPNFSQLFDQYYPGTNHNPLKIKESNVIHPLIKSTIDALLENILEWAIINGDIQVKKIEISCGYAKCRSLDNFICLGDSAAFFAFFKSLNIGLKHGLNFYTQLLKYNSPRNKEREPEKSTIIRKFVWDSIRILKVSLKPIEVYPTSIKDCYLIVTKGLRYGCFKYNLSAHRITKLTSILGLSKQDVSILVEKYDQKMKHWQYSLDAFEIEREQDIQHEIRSNQQKSGLSNFISQLIKSFKWVIPNPQHTLCDFNAHNEKIKEITFYKLIDCIGIQQAEHWIQHIKKTLSQTSEQKRNLILNALEAYNLEGYKGLQTSLNCTIGVEGQFSQDVLNRHRHQSLSSFYNFFKKKTRSQIFIEQFSSAIQPRE